MSECAVWFVRAAGCATMASTESTTHRTTTVKTTEVRSSADGDVPTMTYRPSVNARTVVIQRSSYGGLGSPSSSSSSRERSSQSYGANIPAGAYALVSSSGVSAVKTSRAQEKKDMQDLNERFASYIEKVQSHAPLLSCISYHKVGLFWAASSDVKLTVVLATIVNSLNHNVTTHCRSSCPAYRKLVHKNGTP